jgi:maltooligosyltrehalose trehalohydrolase
MDPDGRGYFHAFVAGIGAGTLYRFELSGQQQPLPDPASRFQPEGVHGPSEVVDHRTYEWADTAWPGIRLEGQVLYEFHVGTFTPEGTWEAAARKLPLLKEIGITTLEMMPVNEFAGRFGWGYDGVDLFAPTRLYGRPDDLRRFVDEAHRLGLGVILDVVYNHFGPAGNYLKAFSDDYFTDRHANEWGEALNYDDANAHGLRDFVIANAAYWIDEFHFDGLRLDATQAIVDDSPVHVAAELTRAARDAAGTRSIVVVGENEPENSNFLRPVERGGWGLDALWNDDFHHSAIVAATGRAEAYYSDYRGEPQEFISSAKHGFLFQGQAYAHQGHRRGSPGLDLAPAAFVTFLENHDQVANTGRGERLSRLTTPGRLRALTTYLLLAPGTPMLFQGQEWGASEPFVFFADHEPELAALVKSGRHAFMGQFASLADPAMRDQLDVPHEEANWRKCVLDWGTRERNATMLAFHRDLLTLRREDPVLSSQRRGGIDGAVVGPEAFVLRWFGEAEGDDRLLIVNFGRDLQRASIADPLVAPPAGAGWRLALSSEDPAYGGTGTPPIESSTGWRLPGHSAVLMRAEAVTG